MSDGLMCSYGAEISFIAVVWKRNRVSAWRRISFALCLSIVLLLPGGSVMFCGPRGQLLVHLLTY